MLQARSSARPRASIRVRAALAGGLVLGLCAGLTVASWTDAEFVTGTFTGSTFELETSLNGGTSYSNAATISPSATGVYPGTTGAVYIPVIVRTSSVSTGGTVSLSHAAIGSPTGLTSVLHYRVIRGAATCTASAFTGSATYVVGSSTFTAAPLVSAALASTPGLALPAAAGTGITYCFEFSLAASGLLQTTYQSTTTSTMTWTFSGTST